MVNRTQTIRRQQEMNYLPAFDHFVRLALKGTLSGLRELLAIKVP